MGSIALLGYWRSRCEAAASHKKLSGRITGRRSHSDTEGLWMASIHVKRQSCGIDFARA